MLNNVRLPEIVEDFSKRTDALNRLVVNATQGILLEVRTMLYDQESENFSKMVAKDHVLIVCSRPVARR
jgi:hypothetical protein